MSSHAATCVVCEQAVAVLYCHQDDAQLCASCDHQVHSANQLAAQHTRVPLSKPVSRCGAPELGASHGAAGPNCMNQHEPSFSFEDDETFAVPDVDLPSVAQDESSPFNAKALLGKDCIPDDFYLNDIDPLWLDRLDVGMDRLPSDILDSLVPELPPPANSPPAAAPAQAAPPPRPAPPVAPAREAPMARPMIMAPMRFLHNQRIVFAPHPAFAQPAPVKQELAVAAVDVDIDSYVPRTLLPMDPAARAQLVASRQEKLQRFREKKRNRHFKKTIRYASRKVYAEVRPRIKGRFARKDEVAAMRAAGELPPL